MASLLHFPLIVATALMLVPSAVWADYTTTQQALGVTNFSGYVIDADATKLGAPARSVIAGSVTLKYKRTGGVIALPDGVDYTLTWSLVDDAGVAHPLDTGGTTFDTTQSVAWTGGVTEVALTSTVNLNPAARLDLSKAYRLRVVATPAFGGNATTHTDAVSRAYGHFTNTVSGDSALNVIGLPALATIDRTWVITSPGVPGPVLSGTLLMARYDDFNLPVTNTDIQVRLRAVMKDVTNPAAPADVPLVTPESVTTLSMPNHTLLGDNPATTTPTFSLVLLPQSLNRAATYQTTAIFEYQESDGSFVSLGKIKTAAQNIFPVSGKLTFGDVVTHFIDLAGVPTLEGAGPNFTMTIPAGKGSVDGRPGVTFGGTFVVSLNGAGDATVVSGTATLATMIPETVGPVNARVRVKSDGIVLSATGATAARLTVYLPAGFTVCAPAATQDDPVLEKNASGRAVVLSRALDANFRPTGTIPLLPPDLRRGVIPSATTAYPQMFCHHEKLPAWFKADNISWNTATGEFSSTSAHSSQWRWVREKEMSIVEELHSPTAVPPLNESGGPDARPANDTFLRHAHQTYPLYYRSFGIKADARGVALLSAHLPMENTEVRPHYPMGTQDFSFVSGTIDFVDNVLNKTTSKLTSVAAVTQGFNVSKRQPGCPDNPPGTNPLTRALTLHPLQGTLRFTDELGLIGEGLMDPSSALEWGFVNANARNGGFAQRTSEFTKGTYYMPGLALSGNASAPGDDDRPGTLLLSGREKPGATPEDRNYVERPDTIAYVAAGLANYAGLNLRVSQEPGGVTGTSLLDENVFGPYPLKTRSKYYVQRAGVTGMHERVTTPGATGVTLFKFPVQLDDYKLSYIDLRVEKSLCNGSVEIPFPSGFSQTFRELRFNERGQPTEARMSGVHEHMLAHWSNVLFTAHSIAFHPQKSTSACTALPAQDKGFIEMGTTFTGLGHGIIPGTVSASLGFKSESGRGELVTQADWETGKVAVGTTIDSTLHLPPNLKIVVPNGGEYTLNPITRGCFTDSNSATPSSPSGVLSFAGTLVVPFFKEMPVHVHLGLAQLNPPIYFMGGWSEGGKTFFSHPGDFDPSHRGYPATVPGNTVQEKLASYRSPSDAEANDTYRPRAQKTWLDVIDFDFPLQWNPTSKRFKSVRQKQADLLIFDIEHELKALSGSGAEIGFGAELPGLPQFNPKRLVMDALDGATGGYFETFNNALTQAAGGVVTDALDAAGIKNAVTALDEVITDRVDLVFEKALGDAINEVLDDAIQLAESNAAAVMGAEQQRMTYVSTLKEQLTRPPNPGNPNDPNDPNKPVGLQAGLHNAIGSVGNGAQGLLNELAGAQGKLQKVRKGVQDLQAIIRRYPDENGKRQIFRNLTSQLAPAELRTGNLAHYLTGALDNLEEVQDLTENPFFNELDGVLSSTEQTLGTAINSANALGVPLKTIATDMLTQQVRDDLRNRLDEVLTRVLPAQTSTLRDVAGPGAAYLKDELRRVIMDKVHASLLGDRIQGMLRDNFKPIRDDIRDGLDKTLGQITTTVKEAFHEMLADGIANNNPLAGLVEDKLPIKQIQMAQSFQGANLRGYARTVGNSISTLRLDGGIKMNPPGMGSGLEFAGFFEFQDNQLEGTPPAGCLALGSTKACTVRAGASFGSKARGNKSGLTAGTGVFDGMNASLEVGFAFKKEGNLIVPLGITGNEHFKGKIKIGLISLNEIDLNVNLSGDNQYLLGYADGNIVEIINAKVWIFAGHTCDFSGMVVGKDPDTHAEIKLLDKYTQHALDNEIKHSAANVVGVFMKAIGGISVNDLVRQLGGPDIPKDVLEVSFSHGYTYFFGLGLNQPGDPTFIAAMSEFGDMKANILGEEAANVESGFAGAASFSLLDWVNGKVAIGVTGGADFEAAEVFTAHFGISGTLTPAGPDFKAPDFYFHTPLD